MLIYPFKAEKDTNNSFLITFPDIPEAITATEDLDENKISYQALNCLTTAFSFYVESRKLIPIPTGTFKNPSKSERADFLALNALMSAKIFLFNEMIIQGISKTELGRRLGVFKQEVDRILDIEHQTKIGTVEFALFRLGKQLKIELVDAC